MSVFIILAKKLEKAYHTTNDNGFRHKNKDGTNISSPMYHRLDDLAHHPTLLGLIASILSRYFSLVPYIDGSDGKPHVFFADNINTAEKKQIVLAWIGAAISGICLWLAHIAEEKIENRLEEDLPVPIKTMIKDISATPMLIVILKSVDIWAGHMMSDVSTSQGIPGIFLSLLKEFSVLPGFRNTKLPVTVDKLYREGELNLPDWGGIVFSAAKKQAFPVMINEVMVRGFYFVRHLIYEINECKIDGKLNLDKINFENIIPFKNRTIVRMLTISTGTFTAVDLADAAIRSVATAGATPAALGKFALRVNYVGVGRFVVAVGTDISMGIKKQSAERERMAARSEQLMLLDAKVYYKQAGMWIAAKDAGQAIDKLCEMAPKVAKFWLDSAKDIREKMDNITPQTIENAEKKNPGLINDILSILED